MNDIAERFALLKGKRIVLYGTGEYAKDFLALCSDFWVVGVLDGKLKNGTFQGLPILTLENLAEYHCEAIIITARQTDLLTIARRVRHYCERHCIELYDWSGVDVLAMLQGRAEKIPGCCLSRDEAEVAVAEHECVSFDVFDTLLMRKTLYPVDVFEIVEKIGGVPKFSRLREKSQQELYAEGRHPTLSDIYFRIAQEKNIGADLANKLMDMELDVEKAISVPRLAIVRLLQYALEAGKAVYLLSDMYLTGSDIDGLLKQSGIFGYRRLVVSSEAKVDKKNGMFGILRNLIGCKSCLHIGDNYDCDVLPAQTQNIDTLRILSAVDMLEFREGDWLLGTVLNYSERQKLGEILAKVYNSPFV